MSPHPWNRTVFIRTLRRGGVTGLVVGLHLELLLFVLRPAAPMTATVPTSGTMRSPGLEVTWVESPPSAPAPAPPPAPTLAVTVPAQRTKRSSHPVKQPRMGQLPVQLDLSLRHEPVSASTRPDYIPGGRGFAAALARARRGPPAPRLPGSEVPVAAPFRMRDPATGSLEQLTHVVLHLFGVVNHTCFKLDRWGQLSREGLAAKGLTRDDLAEQNVQHDCPQPGNRHVNPALSVGLH